MSLMPSLVIRAIDAYLPTDYVTSDSTRIEMYKRIAEIENKQIRDDVIDELIGQGLTKANCGDLEKHAYSIQDGIRDASVRNMHILAAV